MSFIKYLIVLLFFSVSTFASAPAWEVPDDQKTVVAPFKFTEEMQKQGEQSYLKNCQSCHGQIGKDNWVKLDPPPGDLSKEKVQKQTDGELFYRITVGKAPMPEFRNIIPEDERWWLVAYMRSFHPGYVQPDPALKASFSGRIVSLAMKYNESLKKIEVTATETLKDDQKALAAGVEVMLFVQRYFGRMQVGEVKTTNAQGVVLFDFPSDLPGDTGGMVEITATVNDPRNVMKATPVNAELAIGAPTDKPGLTETRAWWSTRAQAPYWIILTYTLSVIIVWGFIFYIVFMILKIRKLGGKQV
jgi:hypothetical protein